MEKIPFPEGKNLGESLRILRENRKMTLRGLSNACAKNGCRAAPGYLCDIEHSKRFPSRETTMALARSLGVPFNHLDYQNPKSAQEALAELVAANAQYAYAIQKTIRAIKRLGINPKEVINRIGQDRP